jgi:hypothetical protein
LSSTRRDVLREENEKATRLIGDKIHREKVETNSTFPPRTLSLTNQIDFIFQFTSRKKICLVENAVLLRDNSERQNILLYMQHAPD